MLKEELNRSESEPIFFSTMGGDGKNRGDAKQLTGIDLGEVDRHRTILGLIGY